MTVFEVDAAGLDGPQSVLKTRKRQRLCPSSPRLQDAVSDTTPLDSDRDDGSSDSTAFEGYGEEEFDELPPAKRRRLSGSEAALSKSKFPISAKVRKYKCNYTDCNKSYTKPTRLREHERSHTGERPFDCSYSGCNKSFLRKTHLQAHQRSHLPKSDRPFVCQEIACGTRFWTSTQLGIHLSIHRGDKKFECTAPRCLESFNKHHQLRSHVALVHSTPGTKNFPCEYEGCSQSFATNQKLKAHVKTHQADRYLCTDATCLTMAANAVPPSKIPSPPYFSTWSALQAHIRDAHPPTCLHSKCNGRTFNSQKNLKAHLKTHEDQENEQAEMGVGALSRRGPCDGRDWYCEEKGCTKSFKSKKALVGHVDVHHHQQRDFICEREGCGRAFGYKHLLQRHEAKVHRSSSSTTLSDDVVSSSDQPVGRHNAEIDFIGELTGKNYKSRHVATVTGRTGQNRQRKVLECPWPHHTFPVEKVEDDMEKVEAVDAGDPCEYVFHRAYDLRRHLLSVHKLQVHKTVLEEWARAIRLDCG